MPRRETPQDVAREREIAEELGRLWRVRMTKLSDYYPCDWAALKIDRNDLLAYVEIKGRDSYTMEQLDALGGVFFSALKWGNCETLCRISDRPFIFVPRTAGILYAHKTWARYMGQHDGVCVDGRYDRGAPNDIEPLVLLRAHRFQYAHQLQLGR
jgi:hypothetical protein